MYTQNFMPLSVVNGAGFRDFCNALNANYRIPCRKTVGSHLTKLRGIKGQSDCSSRSLFGCVTDNVYVDQHHWWRLRHSDGPLHQRRLVHEQLCASHPKGDREAYCQEYHDRASNDNGWVQGKLCHFVEEGLKVDSAAIRGFCWFDC